MKGYYMLGSLALTGLFMFVTPTISSDVLSLGVISSYAAVHEQVWVPPGR